MNRRAFTQLAAMSPVFAASAPVEVALVTHAEGAHLSAYIEGLAKTAEVGAVSLCDPSGATEAAVRKGLGEKLKGSYRSLAQLRKERKPVAALITMEAKVAPPVIAEALDAGLHVMAEKPACVRAEDFAPLAAKANAGKRNLMLAMSNRVDAVMQEARRLVQSDSIGRIYGMELHTIADQTRLTRAEYQKSWFAQKARGGGGHLIWLGIHWLDLAMFLSGSRITEVAGFTSNVGGQPLDVEDSASVSFRFANGTLGNLTSGYYLDRGKHLLIKIWGSKGWIEINHGTDNPLEWYSNADKKTRRFTPPDGPTGYTAFVGHVVRAATGAEPPVLSPDESLYVLRTIFAAYRAAETGRSQKVTV
ncbi:MAG: Gfo/Idh/MocA family oxidoreductase [Acidobacteria bacterium]|nr:Gfo/Idh/MocA family oxidoreductase [Acidobacteriota bacterium]